jgi:transposase
MRRKTYRVISPIEEREELRKLTRTGRARAREILRANILLKADEGGEGQRKVDAAIAKELQVSLGTVATTRQRYVSGGLERALHDRSRSGQPPRLSPRAAATLVAVACSKPPEGRVRWTLELLADRLVELKVVQHIGKETVRQAGGLSLGSASSGASRR